jgi:hypothetical protein
MKRLLLASIFCLAFAAVSNAQDKPQLQLIPPQKLLVFPPQPVSPSVWGVVRGLDLYKDKDFRKQEPVQAREIELKGFNPAPSGVCSVPLLEAHVDAVDPGIAIMPGNTAVAIPQARVPAPACPKK